MGKATCLGAKPTNKGVSVFPIETRVIRKHSLEGVDVVSM